MAYESVGAVEAVVIDRSRGIVRAPIQIVVYRNGIFFF